MGTEIALVYALAGHHVRLADQNPDKAAAALARLREVTDKGCKRGFYEPPQADAAHAMIVASKLEDFGDPDFVVEAVFEDFEV